MPADESAVRRRRGPSMADVAQLAGVSGQTVSRVANDRLNVDATTRDRVRAAMRELGYRPNSAARALRNGEFRSIGVIVFELSSFGTTRTLDAIATAATISGYAINLLPVLDVTQNAVTNAFSRLDEQAVDGVIILIEAHTLDEAGVLLPDGLPVVVVDSSAHYDYPIVDTDQAQGARLATEHLLELGHETVWHLGGPPTSFAADRRRRSWEQTLIDHGRDVPPVLDGDWTSELRVRGRPPARRQRQGDRGLRGQRPDGARPTASAVRARSRSARTTSAWSASTTWKRRPTSGRRSPPSARRSRRSAAEAWMR